MENEAIVSSSHYDWFKTNLTAIEAEVCSVAAPERITTTVDKLFGFL